MFFLFFHMLGYWYFRYAGGRSHQPFQSGAPLYPSPRVAILVPIRDEPPTVVSRMFEHLKEVDYRSLTVVIIDNSTHSDRARLEKHALHLGLSVQIVRKVTDKGFKAGALNCALGYLGPEVEYVLVLDVDHAPAPGILSTMVPVLMNDPDLAFVQAPQTYVDAAPSLVEAAHAYKQRIFYDHICPGLSATGCVFMSGSNVLIRTAALANVAGFDESSVTEDVRTSLNLHQRGWKGTFLATRVADGYSPHNLGAYHLQLRRWATGTYQNFLYALKLFARNPQALTVHQWLVYLGWNGLFYVQGFVACALIAQSIWLLYIDERWTVPGVDIGIVLLFAITLGATSLHECQTASTPWSRILGSKLVFYGELAVMMKALWPAATSPP